jgi:guanine deaminase
MMPFFDIAFVINGHFHSSEHFQKGRVENLLLELRMQYMRAPLAAQLTPANPICAG